MGLFSKLLHKREEKKQEFVESEITKDINNVMMGIPIVYPKPKIESKTEQDSK